jgi:hypothetical protein
MSIVVYWLMSNGEPSVKKFKDSELSGAMSLAELHRRQGMTHVSISSEMSAQVGKPGVDTVVDGKTPDGFIYDWSKQDRAGKPRRR